MFEGLVTNPGGIIAVFVVVLIMDALVVALSRTFTKKL